MKYPFLITAALTSLCLLTSHNSTASDSSGISVKKQARWFEIEVILFKHVAKKTDNTEQFTSKDLSLKKSRAFDLLAPYLQPDISSLKQLLPNCQQPLIKPLYDISFSPYTLWPVKLTDTSTDVLADEDSAENSNNNDANTIDENIDIASSSTAMSVTVLATELNVQNDTAQQNKPVSTELATDSGLSKQELPEQDLSQPSYQVQYANITLPVYDQYPSNKQAELCVIPAEFFQQHLSLKQLAHFTIDGFSVDKLANRVNGIEQWSADENGDITWASNQPYLISQDSLRLKNIANRIKRSRNYTPVLHLGWRQIGETKRKATAMQLYAGDNLTLDYQNALAMQESEQVALEVQEILTQRQQAQTLIDSQINVAVDETTQLSDIAVVGGEDESKLYDTPASIIGESMIAESSIDELSITEQLRLQAKQQQLDNIFQQFALFDSAESNADISDNDTNKLKYNEEEIKKIVAQLSADINVEEAQLSLNNSTDIKAVIKAPVQPWSIDGLFKVHLDRYLYINTELNMVEPANKLSLLTNDKAEMSQNKNQLISFKQSRRVITGEIHYFDHPYIGMVVQIRRFDSTKPADEAVTQAKK